ncbi:condensation domain-containing protein, partial [Chryseolinea serpens]|uniref:condensation domain-containing protein n=1 Tax=Chryseolinea serpens TaxID=947013 RepID=UPI001FE360E1
MKLLSRLRKHNVDVRVVDDELKLGIPQGGIDAALLNDVREHKAEIIAYVKATYTDKDFALIPPAPRQSLYHLTSMQRQFYFEYLLDRSSTAYHVPTILRIEGALDVEVLESSFRQLMLRHESLRTQFEMVDTVPYQRIVEAPAFAVEYAEGNETTLASQIASFTRPFVLEEAPLFRVGLIRLSSEEHLLLIDFHHIITDAVSSEVLIEDFLLFYGGSRPAPLRLQYRDYAEWQQSAPFQEELSESRRYWQSRFSDKPAVLSLSTDYARPSVRSQAGASEYFCLDSKLHHGLEQLALSEQTTLFSVLLSIYTLVLSRWSG